MSDQPMTVEIEVCERLMDAWYDAAGRRQPKYHAQIKGRPGIWGCGQSRDEAIGSLVRSHPEMFGLTLTHLQKEAR